MIPRSLLNKVTTCERMALAVLMCIITGLPGCASHLTPNADPPAPYVGLFTGEFVDGKPLYRFPPIEIVGSRSSIGPST